MSIDFKVEDIHIGEPFKQDPLAFHDRLAGERTDVAKSENSGPIADHGDQVPARCVLESVVRILFDIETWIGNAGGVSQAQIALRAARLRWADFDFSWT